MHLVVSFFAWSVLLHNSTDSILFIPCTKYILYKHPETEGFGISLSSTTKKHFKGKIPVGEFPRSFLPAPMIGIEPDTLVVVARSAWT